MAYAGVEGGGTKFVVAVGTDPRRVSEPVAHPTTTPEETLGRVASHIRALGPVEAVGVACFGPLDLRPASPTFGRILDTPKPGWSGTDVAGMIASALDVPVRIDTDVNGAALGEGRWGAARGLETFLYLTIGTGIGGGGLMKGAPMRGLTHPEMGHLRLPRHPKDGFAGVCPFHGDCLEGLASGPALEARWGRPGPDLGDRAPAAVELESWYLGTALADLTLALSPQRIVIGGGVMGLPGLIEGTRARLTEALGGYLRLPEVADVERFIVPPGLGDRSGVLGAIALAAAG